MALAHPWFLFGLLGLAIPVILHLFELRRPQRVLFTNVSFIKEVKLVTAKQRRLQHLLVLLLRIGFVIGLVLLFCQPFIPAPQQSFTLGADANVILDTSPSMREDDVRDQGLIDDAIGEARQLPAAFSSSARFRLVGASEGEVLSTTGYKTALESLPEKAAVALHDGITKLRQRSGARDSSAAFLLSDFQRSGFSEQDLSRLPEAAEVFLVSVPAKATANIYVDSVALEDEFVRAGAETQLRIRLRNGGTEPVTNCQVRVLVGERLAATYRVEVGAQASVTNVVKVRAEGTGLKQCRIELDDQAAAFDNTYYFTLQAAGKIRIVDIAGQQVATQRLYPNESTFAYTTVRPQTVGASTLAQADMVLLQEVGQVSDALRGQLRQYVQRGGTVVVVPSAEATGRRSYESLFAELGLTSVRYVTHAGKPESRELASPNTQNPFFKDVFAEQTRQPDMPKAAPVWSWSRSAADILQLRDGDAFLSRFRSGAGEVYVFASPLSGGYSDFAANALFVPVMYRLATLSYAVKQQPAYRLDQPTLTAQAGLTGGQREAVYKLTQDSLTFVPIQQVRDGQLVLQVPPAMQQPGFYTLSLNGKPLTTLAFNIGKGESELTYYTTAELREMAAGRPNVHVYEAGTGKSVAAQLRAERVGAPLWRYCLLFALLCLLGEVLVLRFGQRSAQTVPAMA